MIEEKSKDKQVFFVYGGVEAHERERLGITEKSDNAYYYRVMVSL